MDIVLVGRGFVFDTRTSVSILYYSNVRGRFVRTDGVIPDTPFTCQSKIMMGDFNGDGTS